MKESEAITCLRQFFWAVQKIRSDVTEEWGNDPITMTLLESLHPWLFGPGNVIPAFERVLGQVDTGGHLAPMEFYNLVLVATRQAPEIIMVAKSSGAKIPFTQPDMKWVLGWEPEEVAQVHIAPIFDE